MLARQRCLATRLVPCRLWQSSLRPLSGGKKTLLQWISTSPHTRSSPVQENTVPETEDLVSQPWYATNAAPARQQDLNLPTIPADSPPELEELLKYLALELGMENIELFDLRDRNLSENDASIVIICSGKSERHLTRAAPKLLSWSKYQFGQAAKYDGIRSARIMLRDKRRAERKLERQRYASRSAAFGSEIVEPERRVGDWVAVNVMAKGIFVHIFTPQRREVTDLESIFTETADEIDEAEQHAEEQFANKFAAPSASVLGQAQSQKLGVRHFHTARCTRSSNVVKPSELSTIFQLHEQLEQIKLKMAAGHIPKAEERAEFMRSLAYCGVSKFQTLKVGDDTKRQWADLCGSKMNLFMEFYKLVYLSSGRTLTQDREAIVLFYRSLISVSSDTITPQSALRDPKPVELLDLFADFREPALRQLLLQTPFWLEPEVFMLMFTAMINKRKLEEVANMLYQLTLRIFIPAECLNAILAMIIKTGDKGQITHLFTDLLPLQKAGRSLELNDELKAILNQGLEVIDPSGESHKTLLQGLE